MTRKGLIRHKTNQPTNQPTNSTKISSKKMDSESWVQILDEAVGEM